MSYFLTASQLTWASSGITGGCLWEEGKKLTMMQQFLKCQVSKSLFQLEY